MLLLRIFAFHLPNSDHIAREDAIDCTFCPVRCPPLPAGYIGQLDHPILHLAQLVDEPRNVRRKVRLGE